MNIARTATTPSYRGNPVPMVGRGGVNPWHVQLATPSQHPFFMTSCGLNKAKAILMENAQ